MCDTSLELTDARLLIRPNLCKVGIIIPILQSGPRRLQLSQITCPRTHLLPISQVSVWERQITRIEDYFLNIFVMKSGNSNMQDEHGGGGVGGAGTESNWIIRKSGKTGPKEIVAADRASHKV